MLRSLFAKYKASSDFNRFLIKGTLLFLAWRVFRKWMLLKGQYTAITQLGATLYLKTSRFLLSLFGMDTVVDYGERKLWLVDASEAIEIVYDCLGINLFFVFFIFMLAYPGSLKIKSWFIPLGFLSIFLMNAARMAAMTILVEKHPQHADFYHNFLFQALIYIGIFLMWMLFVRLNSRKQKTEKQTHL
ncbi:MAG TPA: exosortase/archaeosortase family protein [Prolixibacteraceae bacterium]|nr:exosortase/archaeosortase family protein [Prolixibacteraceae bacterium]